MIFSHLLSFLYLVAQPVQGQACPSGWTVGQTVQTSSGPVQGHAAPIAHGVSEYLGIPYAEPPVGRRRFQPPVPYRGTAKLDGSRFGMACLTSNITSDDSHIPQDRIEKLGITAVGQGLIKEIINPGLQFNEDCLTLNVWTKPQVGEKRKAVLLWIHGGSFVVGSSAIPSYNGQFFAEEQDVVIVSINYRLSIFGFPGNPLGEQNLGLLDQRLAIEWVRDNIAAFGGDPTRITLFGQSAGGVSIDDYTYAWPCDPIVHGVIAQSGTGTGISNRTLQQANEYWFNASRAAGCGDSTKNHKDVYECMLGLPAQNIAKVLVETVNSGVAMPYSPTMDDKVVFQHPRSRTAAALPMMIGNTDFEFGLFELFTDEEAPRDIWKAPGEEMFGCPAARRADLSVKAGNPTWRYRYFGNFDNLRLSTHPDSGAYHESEIKLLFNTVDQTLGNSTAAEVALGAYLRAAWATFAKDPVYGLTKFGWPRYKRNDTTLIRLGYRNLVGPNLARVDEYDKGC